MHQIQRRPRPLEDKMKYNKISEKDRSTIYEAYINEEDWRSVAKTLKISTSTAYNWLLAKQEKPKKRGGLRISKKNDAAVEIMRDALKRNNLATLEDLRKILLAELQISVCKSTIRNWLNEELITLKNARKKINSKNKDENKAKRSE